MAKKLYVGNLPYDISEDQLRQIFAEVGEVTSAKIIMDRQTGQSKGFGFVEMATDDGAQAAIQRLNGNPIGNRKAIVNEARPQENKGSGGGGGGWNRDRGFR